DKAKAQKETADKLADALGELAVAQLMASAKDDNSTPKWPGTGWPWRSARRVSDGDVYVKQLEVGSARKLFEKARQEAEYAAGEVAGSEIEYRESRDNVTKTELALLTAKEAKHNLEHQSTLQEVRVTADGTPVFVAQFSASRAATISEIKDFR